MKHAGLDVMHDAICDLSVNGLIELPEHCTLFPYSGKDRASDSPADVCIVPRLQ